MIAALLDSGAVFDLLVAVPLLAACLTATVLTIGRRHP